MTSPHIHVPYEKIGDYINFIKKNRLDLEIYFNIKNQQLYLHNRGTYAGTGAKKHGEVKGIFTGISVDS
jgi:hypothetical protein